MLPPTFTQAITAVEVGSHEEGRAMLRQILEVDPTNFIALIWMTEVANSDDERREYLNRILAADPNNATERKGGEMLVPDKQF